MPARKSRAESQQETRQRLVVAARNVFARAGFAGASVDAIAAEAGFSKGAVYSNFDSKEAIFLAVLRSKLETDNAGIAATLAGGGNVSDLLHQFRAYLDAHDDQLTFTVLVVGFLTQPGLSDATKATCAELYAAQRERLATMVAGLFMAANRKMPVPHEQAGLMLMSLTLGLAAQHGFDPDVTLARWKDALIATLETMLSAGR